MLIYLPLFAGSTFFELWTLDFVTFAMHFIFETRCHVALSTVLVSAKRSNALRCWAMCMGIKFRAIISMRDILRSEMSDGLWTVDFGWQLDHVYTGTSEGFTSFMHCY